MHEDLGWSIAQITGAYSLALLISELAAILFGRWLDRHGPRTLMTAGSVLAAVLALGTIPIHALMLRQHPRDMGLLADGASILEADTPATVSIPRVSVTLHDALRERVFWWIMALCTTAARAIAPVGAGLLYTGMNSYTPVLWLLVVTSALASVAAIRAKLAFQPLPGSV